MKSKPSFDEEIFLWDQGIEYVVGIDEVGRGAFAGPVVTAAVIFPKTVLVNPHPFIKEINDSKLLLPKKRDELAGFIQSASLVSAISSVSVGVINKIGILKASYVSFREVIKDACEQIGSEKRYVLCDGFLIPHVRKIGKSKQKAIIKGDRKSVSIAAASIIAKVYRDSLMIKYHKKFNAYNFYDNKGYGTKEHRESIRQFGLTRLHRTSFHLEKFLTTSS